MDAHGIEQFLLIRNRDGCAVKVHTLLAVFDSVHFQKFPLIKAPLVRNRISAIHATDGYNHELSY